MHTYIRYSVSVLDSDPKEASCMNTIANLISGFRPSSSLDRIMAVMMIVQLVSSYI